MTQSVLNAPFKDENSLFNLDRITQ